MKNSDIFKITVINRQTIDMESDTVSETADGTFREKNGRYFIAYKNNGITSMIKIDGDTISVKRIGDIHSEMLFVKGKATEFEYNTQYGAISMSIFTEDITEEMHSDGGKLKFRYRLNTGSDSIINDMTIKIKRK